MTLIGHLRARARLIVGPVIAATIFAYFTYHAVQGDRGLHAWIRLGQQVEDLRLDHGRVAAARSALEAKIRRLHPETLDADLLEERVRAVLGYVHRNDVVIGRPGAGANPVAADPADLGTEIRPALPGGAVVRIGFDPS